MSPQIDGLTAATAENTAPEPMAAVDTSVPEQIPYVPSEARSTKEKAKKDKNAIVQVAKSSSSAKKRKSKVDVKAERPADVQTSDVNEPDSPAPTAKKAKRVPVRAEDIPEFDYSQEPNQLDTFEPASTVKDKRKKPRKSKQRTFAAFLLVLRHADIHSRGHSYRGFVQFQKAATRSSKRRQWKQIPHVLIGAIAAYICSIQSAAPRFSKRCQRKQILRVYSAR